MYRRKIALLLDEDGGVKSGYSAIGVTSVELAALAFN